jgi:hypothetical protein
MEFTTYLDECQVPKERGERPGLSTAAPHPCPAVSLNMRPLGLERSLQAHMQQPQQLVLYADYMEFNSDHGSSQYLRTRELLKSTSGNQREI